MLVCRHWAAVILNGKIFWSRPLFSKKRSAQTTLSRSGDAPLIVRHVLSRHADHTWFLNFMGPGQGFSRCREVVIQAHTPPNFLQLIDCWPSATPLLEVLALSVDHVPWSIPLPTKLWQPAMHLRTLALVDCVLESWHPVSMLNLTTFIYISEGPFASSCYPSGPDMMDFLQCAPNLRTLVLRGPCVYNRSEDPVFEPGVVAVLNRLSRVSLSGRRMSVLNLLQHLLFPSTAILELRLDCKFESEDADTVSRHFHEAIREHYQATLLPLDTQTNTDVVAHEGSFPILDRVFIEYDSADYIGHEATITGYITDANNEPHPSISIILTTFGAYPNYLAPHILRELRPDAVTTLSLGSPDVDPTHGLDIWQNLWRAVPAVEVLNIINFPLCHKPFIRSLSSYATGADSDGCPLPALEELHIRHGLSLHEALKARADRGSRLRLLKFTVRGEEMNMGLEDQMRLNEWVDEIIWETD
ncbi:hypothetical protein CONPUDRAFT_91968 [Coniophora puteana RWD-64-598 SS2]|uniref:F-box domain-containing protein n=1 Tax=Coniophora puteana (strain RWD-64-598) TaxID=741705 RepID=A0A5M3MHS9_CONPW|nr:uncharacterized protein CONPUDRAFT_91968 [Coniophora puteana RWD-64-598 SS2]EIW78607.1 hypothetical protein CONPUDRAFT_91968 [Coniophora puteana RWD-64-598 SS2]